MDDSTEGHPPDLRLKDIYFPAISNPVIAGSPVQDAYLGKHCRSEVIENSFRQSVSWMSSPVFVDESYSNFSPHFSLGQFHGNFNHLGTMMFVAFAKVLHARLWLGAWEGLSCSRFQPKLLPLHELTLGAVVIRSRRLYSRSTVP